MIALRVARLLSDCVLNYHWELHRCGTRCGSKPVSVNEVIPLQVVNV